jgi:hypothetical protein
MAATIENINLKKLTKFCVLPHTGLEYVSGRIRVNAVNLPSFLQVRWKKNTIKVNVHFLFIGCQIYVFRVL